MRQNVIEILDKLDMPLSTIEKDLGLANGLLGKVRKDETRNLSEENFQKLESYFFNKGLSYTVAPVPEKATEPESTRKIAVSESGDLTLSPSPEALEKLKETVDKIEKDFGKGSVQILGDKAQHGVPFISSGSLLLNEALGIGGFPRGRIIEIFGPESSGKTTIAIHLIAEAQRLGGLCAFIDVEHAFDKEYARRIGVNVEALRFAQPDYGEQALEEADRLILSGAFAVVVIDSVAALVPKSELEGEMGDSKMGAQARLMSQACRKLTATVSKTNTICVFINQLRNKIGIVYGSPEVTAGGLALQFYSSVRLDVRRTAVLKDGEEQYGNRVRVKVIKNKVAPPLKTAEFDIIYGEGINKVGEVIDMAVEKSIIKKSGSWYSFGEEKLGQGKDGVKIILQDHPELLEKIIKLIQQ